VLAALGEEVWREHIVGVVEWTINGTVVCTLDDGMEVCAVDDRTVICALDDGTVTCELDDGTVICVLDDALFLFPLEVHFIHMLGTVEVSAVAGDMIERSLNRLPVMVIEGDDMEH
jgi:hypothetical protein